MKKTISLSLGLILLGGSVLSLVDASRLRYHQYLYQKSHKLAEQKAGLRPVNAPIGREWEEGSEDYKAMNGKYMKGRQNISYDKLDTRNNYSKQRQYYGNYTERHMSKRLGYYQTKVQAPERFKASVEPAGADVIKFETFENSEFSMWAPLGWFLASENPYMFVNPDNNFEVIVKKFDADVCDHVYNFDACGIKLSKAENNLAVAGPGELSLVSEVVRQGQWNDTVLNAQIQTRTYMESFVAREMGSTVWYYTRFYTVGVDGRIYMIQTRVEYDEAPYYIKASKRIFDSFRSFAQ
ncbi:MAG TPA: hypothetical protein VIT68_04275 [Candidatus Gracilibacteria bacterium]